MIQRKTEIGINELVVDPDPDLVQGKVVTETGIDLGIDLERGRKDLDLEKEENLDPDLETNTRKVIKETDIAETDPDPKTDIVTGIEEMTDIETETETTLMNCESSRNTHLDTRSTAEDLEVVLDKT